MGSGMVWGAKVLEAQIELPSEGFHQANTPVCNPDNARSFNQSTYVIVAFIPWLSFH